MKFIYGKQNWVTRERGQENCYLLTNGLGGFSSGTMIGSNTRNDHALLMACVEAPNHRYNMIHRLEEIIECGGESLHLSSQEYEGSSESECESGYEYLSSFRFEDIPQWVYQIDGIQIVKSVAMKQGENLIAVKYEIDNRTAQSITLKVLPHLQFTRKGEQPSDEKKISLEGNRISSEEHTVYFSTNGSVEKIPPVFTEGLYYAYDFCDGRDFIGNTWVNHRIEKVVEAHMQDVLEIVYSMKETEEKADEVISQAKAYREELSRVSGMKHEAAKMLAKSADQFVADRASTGGKTILAGFPFFEDWGRDTMIALAGCCISTRQYETVKSILRTFAAYCRDGLMPNLFPEGKNNPMYNTVDAALLFIHAAYLYYEKTEDIAFIKEVWPVMKEIVKWYRKGTAYGIHMDEDGLILAGQDLDQVTWMDVRVGEILPTPRHGKPVEINAYWYNALCVMDKFAAMLGEKSEFEYGALSEKVRDSFQKKFWNEQNECLKDVVSGKEVDNQIRCNQIWAVSMPFTMLTQEQEKKVVDTVFEKLYTPYGLRTLEKSDPEFKGSYGGEQMKRDLAYHQGTVWTFPMGAYYLAYLKTRDYSEEARKTVEMQLEVLESAMREGCIGQLPEIYDGENPSFSRGCFAQAWSVGEILRVYEALESHE